MQYIKTQFLMGTDVTITINSTKNPIDDIYDSFGIFYSLEQEFSRFLINSELSLLNINREMEVSDRFVEILKLCIDVYNKTFSFFNPLVNVSDLGYSGDFEKGIFKKTDHVYNLELEKISIIGNFISLKENQYLDFGGIVKGYTVDLCSDFLRNKGYTDFIINAGGDIFISGNNNLGKIPVVSIDSPFKNSDIFAILELKDISISTSGTYKRKWNIDNNDFHHIINPFFGNNNNELISVSIINEKCSLADAYATSCIAMGLEKSINFLEKNGIDGVIICSDGKVFNSKGIEKYNFEIV